MRAASLLQSFMRACVAGFAVVAEDATLQISDVTFCNEHLVQVILPAPSQCLVHTHTAAPHSLTRCPPLCHLHTAITHCADYMLLQIACRLRVVCWKPCLDDYHPHCIVQGFQVQSFGMVICTRVHFQKSEAHHIVAVEEGCIGASCELGYTKDRAASVPPAVEVLLKARQDIAMRKAWNLTALGSHSIRVRVRPTA